MSDDRVTVRMYRGILGDCFLICHRSGGDERFILIDCGVLQGVKDGRELMVEIARDIAGRCKGVLDLVVVTHEHADHLSGFGHASDIFFGEAMTIKKLWLAWTENDQDKQAQTLRARFHKAKKALKLTAALAAHGLGADERVGKVAKLQDFIGFDADETVAAAPRGGGPAAAQKRRWTGAEVIKELKSKAGEGNIEYLEPGQVVRAGAGDGLRVFVLGPPRAEARLKKDLPSSGAAKEVYLARLDEALSVASAARAFLPAAALADRGEPDADDDEIDPSPFAKPRQRPIADAKALHRKGTGTVESLYFGGPQLRTIERDWLDAAEALALKMDSDTNNTSLVLAFELPDRQVLLFAADAQVGNWLSWGDQTYPAAPVAGEPQIVIDDLLSRVTLYKVGHHASHNATLRDRGLERMTDPRLTAMIPVVEAVAEKKQWKMPYPELEERLLAKTGKRVIRGDDKNVPRERAAFEGWPHAGLAYQDPKKGGLWVEVAIPRPADPPRAA